ncbi:unnamed protein product, partial [Pylaiella littoralis]
TAQRRCSIVGVNGTAVVRSCPLSYSPSARVKYCCCYRPCLLTLLSLVNICHIVLNGWEWVTRCLIPIPDFIIYLKHLSVAYSSSEADGVQERKGALGGEGGVC